LKKKLKTSSKPNNQKPKIGLIIVLFSFLFLLVFTSYFKWSDVKSIFSKVEYYQTSGIITHTDRYDYPVSTRLGSSIKTKYRIEYLYTVSGKEFAKRENIDQDPTSIVKLIVFYNPDNPRDSFIEIK